jgi:phosphatidylinositol alpha-mannosyltransferase
MTLRIALTHAFCWPEVRRGGERYLHELAGALARRNHDVTIVSGSRRSPSITSEDGVRVVRIPRGNPAYTSKGERWFGRAVLPLLAAGRFDVVHSLGARDAAASIAAARLHPRRRTVYTNLGLPLRASWERRPDGAAHQRVVDGIDVYGCLSRYAQARLNEDYARLGALTPGGVRLDRFRPTVGRTKHPTILFPAANDEPRKGLATLLEAVAILATSEPDVRLLLSGPGDPSSYLAQAPEAARERTEVLPLGALDEQPHRYASAWVTALPSRNEAFGLVLVESLACGTPIVASDHASLPELMEPGIGATAKVDDPASLATACRRSFELAATPGIAEACRAAAARHDWDTHVAPSIEALYLGSAKDGT